MCYNPPFVKDYQDSRIERDTGRHPRKVLTHNLQDLAYSIVLLMSGPAQERDYRGTDLPSPWFAIGQKGTRKLYKTGGGFSLFLDAPTTRHMLSREQPGLAIILGLLGFEPNLLP